MHVKRLKLALQRLTASVFAGGALLMAAGPTATQTAVANGDTRTINLFHAHTKETISATFRVNGSYDGATLKRLNWFLRDWRNDDVIEMDPRLFDVIWEAQRGAGSTAPIQVNSAYRSPATNSMLRRRSRGVAEFSQHMRGKAMDIHVSDVPIMHIRETAMRMQRGGVGYYPSSGFVHLDVGSVRAWPRMSYDQLARIFPDGKTVHLASNGQPMPRYEEARAELASRGGGAPTLAQVRSKSFLATLFGWGEEDDEAPQRVAPRGRAPAPVQTAALQRAPVEDGSAAAFYAAEEARRSNGRLAYAEANRPRGQTFIGPTPTASAALAVAARAPEPAPAPAAAPLVVAAVTAPLPPPRPAALLAALAPAEAPGFDAPLPPIRPRALVAEVATPVAPVRRSGVDQIAGLIGSPVGKVATTPGLPSVITDGADGAPVASTSGMLAYAAPASSQAALPSRPDPRGSMRTARAAPMAAQTLGVRTARLARASAQSPALTPARLDRSNFVALTDPQAFSAHAELASALGATLAPLRGAARKEAANMMFSASSVVSPLTAPAQGFARLQ